MRAARRFPGRLGGLAAITCAIGVAAMMGPSLVAASSGTTGNAAAIALYRTAAKATNDLPAYVIIQHGYVRINDSIGKHRTSEWAWGQDQFQPGEVATTEHLVLVQRHGVVAWIEDTLYPDVKCDSGGTCPAMLPLQFFITKSRAYAGIISSPKSPTAACFTRESTDDVPYSAGTSWWWAVGAFTPIVRHGAFREVTSSYPNSGQLETETDWVRSSTTVFVRSSFRVSASHTHHAFDFSASYTKLRKVPSVPHLTICS
jgi:hypothetical protein